MIFITSDENVLVITTGLGWPAYEKTRQLSEIMSPFSFNVSVYNFRGEIHVKLGYD
ncbi:hypothetical protein HanLR1_Chr02g0051551 [Helianthus annuus]|nr:hypothetical protein HanHA89_Chr02g0053941 [Helianthus annuus]KAJ0776946.1 hypothetical protein HanLR1_Chr02g0051551 [Helianthus annuus]